MPERRSIDERVGALERRLEAGDGHESQAAGTSQGTGHPEAGPDRTELLERIETLESTVADLEAGLQAVRGYVGTVEHVNDTVERRANAALAAVERLESAPKTPPPTATATQQAPDSSSRTAEPEEDDDSQAGSGLVERLRSLR